MLKNDPNPVTADAPAGPMMGSHLDRTRAATRLKEHQVKERKRAIKVAVGLLLTISTVLLAVMWSLPPPPPPPSPQKLMNQRGAWVHQHPQEALSGRLKKEPPLPASASTAAPRQDVPFKESILPSKSVEFSEKKNVKPATGTLQNTQQATAILLEGAKKNQQNAWVVDEHGYAVLPDGQKVKILPQNKPQSSP